MADDRQEERETTEVHIDDETQKNAEKAMAGLEEKYEPGNRPTTVLPGTGGMVSGTAFADKVDDNGELKDDSDRDDPNKDDSAKDDSAKDVSAKDA